MEISSIRAEKIVLIGPTSAGKTSIVNRIVNNEFDESTESTIGATYLSKTITIGSERIRLDIWDTSGSEKYKSLAPMYYRDARIAIVVFDVTSTSSLLEAEKWVYELKEHGPKGVIIYAAANKTDCDNKEVTTEMIKEFVQKNSIVEYSETSAATGTGISDLFNNIAQQLLTLPPSRRAGQQLQVGENIHSQPLISCC